MFENTKYTRIIIALLGIVMTVVFLTTLSVSVNNEHPDDLSQNISEEKPESLAPGIFVSGYIEVEEFGCSVPFSIIHTPYSVNVQDLIDRENLAVYLDYEFLEQPIICDHDYQEFSWLKKAAAGTKAVIHIDGEEAITIVCTGTANGHNEASDIVDEAGRSYANERVGDYVLYTCDEGENGILLTTWDIVKNK